jgi:hypothetical protein
MGGMRLAVGAPGSGTLYIAMEMLSAAGMVGSNVQLRQLATAPAAQALLSGEIDAAFFFASAEAPVVKQLLAAPDIKLMNWERAEAYARRFPYLTLVTLPASVIDLQREIPATEVKLLASTAELVAREGLHPALSDLLIETAQKIHSGSGLLERPGEFPSARETDIPLSEDAQRYYTSGKTFLNRYLPFWAATLVQRALLFLVPILAVLIPMFKLVPPLYRWRARSHVYRWYGDLMMLEYEIKNDPDSTRNARYLKRLEWIEEQVTSTWPPPSFAQERYALHAHIRAIRHEIERHGASAEQAEEAKNTTATKAGS